MDSWTNYLSYRWIDNPFPSPSPTGSPEIIPDSEPSSFTPAYGDTDGSSEEELASVPSNVQVGSLGASEGGEDLSARPTRSPGGT